MMSGFFRSRLKQRTVPDSPSKRGGGVTVNDLIPTRLGICATSKGGFVPQMTFKSLSSEALHSLRNYALILFPLISALPAYAADPDYSVLYGRWDPGSKAFEGEGVLQVDKNSISWGRCINLPYRIASDQQLPMYPGNIANLPERPGITWRVIVLETVESTCQRHGKYIQFGIPSDYQEHADIVFYSSPKQFQNGYYDWGVFGKTNYKSE